MHAFNGIPSWFVGLCPQSGPGSMRIHVIGWHRRRLLKRRTQNTMFCPMLANTRFDCLKVAYERGEREREREIERIQRNTRREREKSHGNMTKARLPHLLRPVTNTLTGLWVSRMSGCSPGYFDLPGSASKCQLRAAYVPLGFEKTYFDVL